MGYVVVREPFMLLETVSMLYKYVNGITFQSELSRLKQLVDAPVYEILNRRAGWLQEILFKVCKGLDPTDPVLQKYFSKVSLEVADVCLAYFMTHSFVTAKKPGYWDNVDEICAIWRDIQDRGARIDPRSINGFLFSQDSDETTDLFSQVKVLNLPPEFRLELYEAMKDFEKNLRSLAERLEPLASKLEENYRQERWLLEESVDHWEAEFQKMPPLDFLAAFAGKAFTESAGEETVVAVSLMNSSQLVVEMASGLYLHGEHNVFFVGACMTTESIPKRKGANLERIGVILKYLGDWKRLEILRQLNKKQGYGLELADRMGMDSGNMSRILVQLHQYGFLQQEREALRNYYRTDRTVIRNFLKAVETAILEDES